MAVLIDYEYDSNCNLISAICEDDGEKFEMVRLRHGEWIDGQPYTNSHWRVCSVCHKSADHPAGGHEYCGHCGAKMDGGENDP